MAPGMRPVVAAFDLDGTLTDRDCVLPYLSGLIGKRQLLTSTAIEISRQPRVLNDRDSLKAVLAASLAGIDNPRADDWARRFVTDQVKHWFRPPLLSQLLRHRDAGHHVVIVSASFDRYVKLIAEDLEVDFLATGLESSEGILTGRLVGPNCRGAEKVVRLSAWAELHLGAALTEIDLHAFGDSKGDRQLLEVAGHSCLVRPARRWSLV